MFPIGCLPFGVVAWGAPILGDLTRATLREALVAHLKADAGVAAVVGARIYPDAIPDTATFPALASQVIGIERPRQLAGPTSIVAATVQLAAASKLRSDTVAAAEAIRQSLDGFRGTLGAGISTLTVVETVVRNERDLADDSADGTGGPYRRTVLDVLIRYREPKPVRLN